MDRIQRALDLSRRQRAGLAAAGVPLIERAELVRPEPPPAAPPPADSGWPAPEPATGESRTIESREDTPLWTEPLERLRLDRSQLIHRRIVLGSDRGPAARAYRMLRAQVLQRVRTSGCRTIAIVSAVAGEGKTITAINLALSLAAEPNQNVALVDLDFRRPGVARTLGVAPRRGLDSWLGDDSPVTAVTYEIEGIDRLHLIPTLEPVVASSEALAGRRVRELMTRLRTRSDSQIVIVDQGPALLSDDVLTLAPLVDGYILVITESRTRRDDIGRVFELLGKQRLIGTVLNGSSDSEQRAY
jgi:Mrp family chromosome partitioning ATPase